MSTFVARRAGTLFGRDALPLLKRMRILLLALDSSLSALYRVRFD